MKQTAAQIAIGVLWRQLPNGRIYQRPLQSRHHYYFFVLLVFNIYTRSPLTTIRVQCVFSITLPIRKKRLVELYSRSNTSIQTFGIPSRRWDFMAHPYSSFCAQYKNSEGIGEKQRMQLHKLCKEMEVEKRAVASPQGLHSEKKKKCSLSTCAIIRYTLVAYGMTEWGGGSGSGRKCKKK